MKTMLGSLNIGIGASGIMTVGKKFLNLSEIGYSEKTRKEFIEQIKNTKDGFIPFVGETSNGMTTTIPYLLEGLQK